VESAAFPEPGDQEQSTKRDLLARYCRGQKNSSLANDIVRAYEGEIKQTVRPVANSLCPGRCDREDFFRATLNRSRLKFVRGVCSYEGKALHSWKAWVKKVARTAALEELDFFIHRRWKIAIIEIGPDSLLPETIEENSESNQDAWDHVYRSSHHVGVMAERLPPPDASIKAEECKSIILRLLVLHAQKSQNSADSANAIRLRYWDDWNVIRISEYRFGNPMTAGKQQAIRRELIDDYDKLRALLSQEFGITSLSQI
jgi:hypothetical protein